MIKPFEKVLVATDFSDHAHRALERAIDLAQRYEASLHVVHVWDMPLLARGASMEPSVDWSTLIEASARAELDELVSGLRTSKLSVTSTLTTGSPWERILADAEAQGADLIVVGTHGRTGIRRVMMGSVAERVVRMSPVAVLTIH